MSMDVRSVSYVRMIHMDVTQSNDPSIFRSARSTQCMETSLRLASDV